MEHDCFQYAIFLRLCFVHLEDVKQNYTKMFVKISLQQFTELERRVIFLQERISFLYTDGIVVLGCK